LKHRPIDLIKYEAMKKTIGLLKYVRCNLYEHIKLQLVVDGRSRVTGHAAALQYAIPHREQ